MWGYKSGLGFGHRTIDKNGINGRDVFVNLQGVRAGIEAEEGKCAFHRGVLVLEIIPESSCLS